MENIKEVSIIVKWSGNEYPMIDLTEQDTVAVLKHEIFKVTRVRPERQKLLNLKYKGGCNSSNMTANSIRTNGTQSENR